MDKKEVLINMMFGHTFYESNILEKCYKKLNLTQKKIYDNKVFIQLRNLTRYTFPETVDAKNRLEKSMFLKI